MKTYISLFLIFFLLLSCNKRKNKPTPVDPDETAPALALKGKSNDTISLNSVYNDLGVIAMDETDGDISNNVVVTGSVNVNFKAVYTLIYNIADAAGNAAPAVSRTVHVVNDSERISGTYSVEPNCGTYTASAYITTLSASSTINNYIEFSPLVYNNTGKIAGGIYDAATKSFTLVPVSDNSGNAFDGSGYFMSEKKITFSSRSENSSGSFFCTSIMTRKE